MIVSSEFIACHVIIIRFHVGTINLVIIAKQKQL